MSTSVPNFAPGIRITAPVGPEFAAILTPAALSFVAFLQRGFRQRRQEILAARVRRQQNLDAGRAPDFLPETAHIRADDTWQVAPCDGALADRKVELVVPARRTALDEALASGASACVADFEDGIVAHWDNLIEGQIALCGVAGGAQATPAALLVRPRGWHLEEAHVLIDGAPCAAAIFDFGLHFFHNAKTLLAAGRGPWYCLPKLQSHLEARLWNDIFCLAQEEAGLPRGGIRAAAMIETLDAAFEMDEILYELREHGAGLKIGRNDHVFSAIRTMHKHAGFCLAERAALEAPAPFLRACELLLIKTCHRRGTLAIAATATGVPMAASTAANDAAFAQARAALERDAGEGFDGAAIAHPGMVAAARGAFERVFHGANQTARQRDDVDVGPAALLDFSLPGPISEAGLRREIRIGIAWLEACPEGSGRVTHDKRLEDTASAEVARALVWHWIRSPGGVLDDGRKITREMVSGLVHAEADGADGTRDRAAKAFEQLCLDEDFAAFITTTTAAQPG